MTEELDLPYVYHWRNTPERARMYGRRCRILSRGSKMQSVLIEFEDGERVIVSSRALRRAEEHEDQLTLD